MTAALGTVERALEVARAQIGTLEHPAGSNCNPYSAALGRPCEFWCADGISWVLRAAGVTPRPNTASTRAMRAWFADRGRLDMTPRRGDVVFYSLTGRNGRGQPDHVELLLDYIARERALITIGFNTSSDDRGSQDNGGGVFQRKRRLDKVIDFGHPHYDTEDDMLTDDQAKFLKQAYEETKGHYNLIRVMGEDITKILNKPSGNGGGLSEAQIRAIIRDELDKTKLIG